MTNEIPVCGRCGEPHVVPGTNRRACTGHRSSDGVACSKDPMKDMTVCRNHGGSTPQARVARDKKREAEAAARQLGAALAEAYGDGVPEVDPASAMLQAVSWKFAEVVVLRSHVATLAADSPGKLVWGITQTRTGVEGGTTRSSQPNVWLEMLHRAEDALVRYAAAARAARCDEARIEAAEKYGSQIAGVLQAFAAAALRALLEMFADQVDARAAVERGWPQIVRSVAPMVLRAAADEPTPTTERKPA